MTVQEVLQRLPAAMLSYDEWLEIGAALYHSGYDLSDWDDWSRADSRYRDGDCEKRWRSFGDYTGTPKTEASIFHIAKEYGIDIKGSSVPPAPSTLDWDSTFYVDVDFVEGKPIEEPAHWNQKQQMIDFLSTLFRSDEYVGYVLQSMEKDGKYIPANSGSYKKTCGEIIRELEKNDIEFAIGSYDTNAGGWVRFNPLDGNGCKAANVTEYRYCLVESDDMSLEKQYAMFTELKLPIATLTHSGGKSLHAIVKVNAANRREYQQRFEYIQKVCEKSGFTIDKATKDPSRLSRLAGLYRAGRKQFLIATNIGCSSWDEWVEYIEGTTDDLPEIKTLNTALADLPPLKPVLIDGILRKGHKMIISSFSKAGKTFLLMELCCALAQGGEWLGLKCEKSKVLYINFEVDEASCFNRFNTIYRQSDYDSRFADNIAIWNLRGKSAPLEKLVPSIVSRCKNGGYSAIILDPIYKVSMGDENSAEAISKFCNQLDKIADKLDVSIIYCHHYSKGSQAEKQVIDRSSGSGVFSRDADAIVDIIELDVSRGIKEDYIFRKRIDWLKAQCNRLQIDTSVLSEEVKMLKWIEQKMSPEEYEYFKDRYDSVSANLDLSVPFRVEGILREFPRLKPINLWFTYPLHIVDDSSALATAKPIGSKGTSQKKTEEQREAKDTLIREAFEEYAEGEMIRLSELAKYIGKSTNYIYKWLEYTDDFINDKGILKRIE